MGVIRAMRRLILRVRLLAATGCCEAGLVSEMLGTRIRWFGGATSLRTGGTATSVSD
jgi:hypothetical protein